MTWDCHCQKAVSIGENTQKLQGEQPTRCIASLTLGGYYTVLHPIQLSKVPRSSEATWGGKPQGASVRRKRRRIGAYGIGVCCGNRILDATPWMAMKILINVDLGLAGLFERESCCVNIVSRSLLWWWVFFLGAAYSHAENSIRKLVDQCGLPFLPTPMGKGVVPDNHPYCVAAARSR